MYVHTCALCTVICANHQVKLLLAVKRHNTFQIAKESSSA